MIEIKNLTVQFGGVIPLDDVSMSFTSGVNGLIGPNGAGKTTFFNVLSGFVTPATGTASAFGENLFSMAPFRRARWGVRRTFQTEQAIGHLSVFENVLAVLDHTPKKAKSHRDAAISAVDFTGLSMLINEPVSTLTAGERRSVELARAVAGSPRLLLLDEPAAGLPDNETSHLMNIIKGIPAETGATVILVDHDMNLVSGCCETASVLDFGKLIASGETAEVLKDPVVVNAYLGDEAEASS